MIIIFVRCCINAHVLSPKLQSRKRTRKREREKQSGTKQVKERNRIERKTMKERNKGQNPSDEKVTF